jgi:hypothetical protein
VNEDYQREGFNALFQKSIDCLLTTLSDVLEQVFLDGTEKRQELLSVFARLVPYLKPDVWLFLTTFIGPWRFGKFGNEIATSKGFSIPLMWDIWGVWEGGK